ncbi:MAG TPA: hypothetical protein VLL76_05630 [Candidatus Omnitrophota bacterium]|nr:hypothetical protein [Candidatus Omnitrophota bacterium]
MALDIDDLVQQMISAAQPILGAMWQNLENQATSELQGVAQQIVKIAQGVADKEVDEDTAKLLLSMQLNNAVGAIAAATEEVEAAAQDAVNAAMAKVRDTVNAAVGFVLVP